MSVSVRPLLVTGIALATAGVVATGPVVVPVAAPAALPAVHVQDIRLAGIGQNIYQAITPTVQYVVGGGSYLVNFIPLIGGPIAAQININYFQGIQPAVEATVNYLAGVVADPVNIIATTQAYGVTLYGIGYNYVSAQLTFLGLPPLTPLAPITASAPPRAKPLPAAVVSVPAVRRADRVRPAAAVVRAAEVRAPAAAAARASRSGTAEKAPRGARASAHSAPAD